IVVAPVSGPAYELDNAVLREPPGVCGDAGLADFEFIGDVVEGEGLIRDEEEAEDSTCDPWESVGFELESEAFDEAVVLLGHVVQSVYQALNVTAARLHEKP